VDPFCEYSAPSMELPPVPALSANKSAVLTDMWSSELYSAFVGDGAILDIRDHTVFDINRDSCMMSVGCMAPTGGTMKPMKVAWTADDVHKTLKKIENQGQHDLIEPGVYARGDSIPKDIAAEVLAADNVVRICPARQPFEVVVNPQVSAVCDVHAHMCEAEIIGLLAGYWYDAGRPNESANVLPAWFQDHNAETNWVFVQQAFPCLSVPTADEDGSTDVEMDSESEWKAREAIHAAGMTVVGWYHSHPKFKPFPSAIDIFNQNQYQTLMRHSDTGFEPFIGLIVATYDKAVKVAPSVHQWFHTAPHTVLGRNQSTIDIPMGLHISACIVKDVGVADRIGCNDAALSNLLGQVWCNLPPDDTCNRISSSGSTAAVSLSGRRCKRNISRLYDGSCLVSASKKNKVKDEFTSDELNPQKDVKLIDCFVCKNNIDNNISEASKRAVSVMQMCPKKLRGMFLSLLALGFYYSDFHRRVSLLTETWKDCGLKLSKLLDSLSKWLCVLMPGDESYRTAILSKYEAFIQSCWITEK
jgi:proteasome lid subunit RPN8/RPN11